MCDTMPMDRTEIARRMLTRRTAPNGVFPLPDTAIKQLAGASPLVFYAGYDPTGAHIHLGHSVSLLLLKSLARELGHTVIVLFGDFTARIGDPTGKASARKTLSPEEIEENVSTWDQQIATLFGDVPYTIRRNSEWLDTMTFGDVIRLSTRVTVQQMLAREMFQERIKQERPIYLNEFLYPLAQGYDSVAMRVDGEVGGNDQIFNMLVGRDLERELIGKEKLVLATPLLVDAATGKKMSKSEGELIALTDSPQEIRRKILAIDDGMTRTVFMLCTEVPEERITELGEGGAREFKEALASELVRMYHGEKAVAEAGQDVEAEISGLTLDKGLVVSGTAGTMSAAHNLIDQGATEIGGKVIKEWKHELRSGDRIRVGKGKFVKVK